jgi:hypothetical protein
MNEQTVGTAVTQPTHDLLPRYPGEQLAGSAVATTTSGLLVQPDGFNILELMDEATWML